MQEIQKNYAILDVSLLDDLTDNVSFKKIELMRIGWLFFMDNEEEIIDKLQIMLDNLARIRGFFNLLSSTLLK